MENGIKFNFKISRGCKLLLIRRHESLTFRRLLFFLYSCSSCCSRKLFCRSLTKRLITVIKIILRRKRENGFCLMFWKFGTFYDLSRMMIFFSFFRKIDQSYRSTESANKREKKKAKQNTAH